MNYSFVHSVEGVASVCHCEEEAEPKGKTFFISDPSLQPSCG